jgi:hypothetical protein
MSNPLLERLHALGGWDEISAWYGEAAADYLLSTAIAWVTYPESRRGLERIFQATLRELDIN